MYTKFMRTIIFFPTPYLRENLIYIYTNNPCTRSNTNALITTTEIEHVRLFIFPNQDLPSHTQVMQDVRAKRPFGLF